MSDQNGHTRRSTCGLPKVDGTPCGQVVGPAGCLWHGTAEEPVSPGERQAIAKRGGALNRYRALPADAPKPAFQSRDQIVAHCEDRAGRVECGEMDPKVSAESRGWALVAMQAWELEALLRLNRIERRLKRKRATS